jgi:hypothetical protein
MAVIFSPFGVGQKNTSIGFCPRRFGFALFLPLFFDSLLDFGARDMPGSMRENAADAARERLNPMEPAYNRQIRGADAKPFIKTGPVGRPMGEPVAGSSVIS